MAENTKNVQTVAPTNQAEDVHEFITLLKQMSDSDRMVIKGMMMWAAGEDRPMKTA